jgi:hypothetical protein
LTSFKENSIDEKIPGFHTPGIMPAECIPDN